MGGFALAFVQYIGRMMMSVKGHETLHRILVVLIAETVFLETRTVIPADLSFATPIFAFCAFVVNEPSPNRMR